MHPGKCLNCPLLARESTSSGTDGGKPMGQTIDAAVRDPTWIQAGLESSSATTAGRGVVTLQQIRWMEGELKRHIAACPAADRPMMERLMARFEQEKQRYLECYSRC